MCCRYFFADKMGLIIEKELEIPFEYFADEPAGDVTPGMSPMVITVNHDTGKLRTRKMFWGLSRHDKSLIINARAETASEKSLFGESIQKRRCLIPAALFYEWDSNKNKVTFTRMDNKPIYLAGFYQITDNKECFVVLTTQANASMIRVHDRMPVMINKEDVHDWLFDDIRAFELLKREMPLLNSNQTFEQLSLDDFCNY